MLSTTLFHNKNEKKYVMRGLLKVVQLFRRLYWRLMRPETRGIRAILVAYDGKILLVRHKYQEGWFLPGGKISGRENDEDAIRRELREELGIEIISHPEKLGEYLNTYEYKKDTIVVFVIHDFTQRSKKHFEIEEQRLFDPRNLPSGVSPGTKKRIEEWLGERLKTGQW